MIIFEGSTTPVALNRTATLVVTRGLPGCGKSTAAWTWAAEAPDVRVVLGRDEFRRMWGCLPVGTPAQEAAITVAMDGAVEALLRSGRDVCVDSTHIQPGTLAHWRDLAAWARTPFDVLDFTHVPVGVCVARDEARRDTGGRHVGEEVIRAMAARYLPDAVTGG